MNLLSLTFAVFFMISVICYYAVPKKMRWSILLLFSLVFYVWSVPYLLIYLLFSAATTYLYGRWAEKSEKHGKGLLGLVIGANLAVLLFVKFYPLFEMKFHFPALNILMPMGISFYTLQVIAYCVDVSKGKTEAQKNFFKYLPFVSFFPQILQGPIPRYNQLKNQLFEGHGFDYRTVKFGFQLILWGMFLKMVIADRAAIFVNMVFPEYYLYEGTVLAVAAVLYSIQLYTDFLGCVCIAMGAAKVYGIDLQTNFERPYLAVSVKDFWRRWHISLSSWLRDYVYIPLGGNRKGKLRRYVNLMLTFLVSGIWHGSGMQYIFWGLMQGGYQIAGEVLEPVRCKVRNLLKVEEESAFCVAWKRLCTFVMITISWVIFRSANLRAGLSMVKKIVTDITPWVFFDGTLYEFGIEQKSFLALILCIGFMAVVENQQEKKNIRELLERQHIIVRWGIYLGAIALVAVLGVYGPGYSATQFLYGQF
ncbi:MAG: MBOAT family protein [Lachnospiraceae bacterium]|nr:MBOAT family protein [Lachnospiraceae bacterium]